MKKLYTYLVFKIILHCFIVNSHAIAKNKCVYRYNKETDLLTKLTYDTLLKSNFKFKNALYNDYQFYMHKKVSCSKLKGYICYKSDLLKVYYKTTKYDNNKVAAILLHGNSVTPDDFYNNKNTYLNNVGRRVYEKGIDTYAPYITHLSAFQNSRSRLARMTKDLPFQLDVMRAYLMLEKIHEKYKQLVFIGAGYGGHVAVELLKYIKGKNIKLYNKVKEVISFEGYATTKFWIKNYPESLFNWNWEMIFPRASEQDFKKMLKNKKVFLAYSSCYKYMWEKLLKNYPRSIFFNGGHEVNPKIVIKRINDLKFN